MRQIAAIIVGTLFTVIGGPLAAQEDQTPRANGPVELLSPPMGDSPVERWPAIRDGEAVTAAAAARINQILIDDGAQVIQGARACESEATVPDAWLRSVDVTMAGPHYVSLVASDSYDCGAYPNDDVLSAFVFDLETGLPVDWIALFPAGASAVSGTAADGTDLGLVAWPGLARRVNDRADPACKDVIDTDHAFSVWPDARDGVLRAVPAELPHAVQACATPVSFTAGELRRFGFAARLVDALDHAHALQKDPSR